MDIAEIAYNNSKHASTGFTPYYLNSGSDIHLPIDNALSSSALSANPSAAECVQQMHKDLVIAKENIVKAQQRQEKYANRRRRVADEYEVGDRVMLSTEGMKAKSGKLLSKFIGPFQVVGVPSLVNVKLLLPSQLLSSRTHDVFHISKVKHFVTSTRDSGGNLYPGITSSQGVRQGDPLSSLLFALAIQPVYEALVTKHVGVHASAILDDVTLVGTPDELVEAYDTLTREALKIGLQIQPGKCQFIYFHDQLSPLPSTVHSFMQSHQIPYYHEAAIILGAPIGINLSLIDLVSTKNK